MNCRDAIARLYEYIDGEIGTAERSVIAAHLEACRGCFDEFEAERLFRELVMERSPRPQVREEFKAHLLARLADESREIPVAEPIRRRAVPVLARFAIAATLLLAVGLGAAYVGDRMGPEGASWVTLGYYHHDMIEVKEIGLESADLSQARTFLGSHMGVALENELPDTPPAGMTLHSSCIVPWKDGSLAHVELDAGQIGPVSFFAMPARSVEFHDEPRYQINGRTYRTMKLGCCRLVCWQDDEDYVCALLGDCGAHDLLTYAEAWHGHRGSEIDPLDPNSALRYSSSYPH
jgi:anti-sigma factor (TIGR02949 family)